jgi:hypothetical protein
VGAVAPFHLVIPSHRVIPDLPALRKFGDPGPSLLVPLLIQIGSFSSCRDGYELVLLLIAR